MPIRIKGKYIYGTASICDIEGYGSQFDLVSVEYPPKMECHIVIE